MTAAGFSTALASFTGQNYGAGNYERIRKGYRMTLRIACSFGAIAGILFWIFNKEMFNIFVTEEAAILAGGDYLRILALSQLYHTSGIGKYYIHRSAYSYGLLADLLPCPGAERHLVERFPVQYCQRYGITSVVRIFPAQTAKPFHKTTIANKNTAKVGQTGRKYPINMSHSRIPRQ